VIHDEGPAQARWNIPQNLNVTLFANDKACCLPICRDPECPDCMKLNWVGCSIPVDHIADASSQGAKVLVGGKRAKQGGTFYEPTVLIDVTPEMKIFREETFGPVAPLIRFRDEAEAVELANRTEFGLASYFYARDIGRIFRVAEGLEYGMVGINTGFLTTEVAPFGGVKQSGLGREGSKYGIDEYVEIKYMCLGGIGG